MNVFWQVLAALIVFSLIALFFKSQRKLEVAIKVVSWTFLIAVVLGLIWLLLYAFEVENGALGFLAVAGFLSIYKVFAGKEGGFWDRY